HTRFSRDWSSDVCSSDLTFAEGLTRKVGGARIYLKREDLNHTGAHKINNTLGQALLALRMGKKRLVAETGAGQHGVASATVAALLGMECVVFMGEEDVQRQKLNVFRMKLLGADRKSTRLNSSHVKISYAVFCLKKKNKKKNTDTT